MKLCDKVCSIYPIFQTCLSLVSRHPTFITFLQETTEETENISPLTPFAPVKLNFSSFLFTLHSTLINPGQASSSTSRGISCQGTAVIFGVILKRLGVRQTTTPMLALEYSDRNLIRMTETLSDPIILTTDSDFRVYRRHSRQVVPCVMPS
jgi:hypothetical protein